MSTSAEFSEVNAAVLAQCPQILQEWLPGGRVLGDEYACGSISGGPGSSFKVNFRSGLWKEHSGGPGGKDLVALFAAINGLRQRQALRNLAVRLGVKLEPPPSMIPDVRLSHSEAVTPPVSIAHPRLGKPNAIWAYKDRHGHLLGYTCRFDTSEGKQILPFTLRMSASGNPKLAWKGFQTPRPLYGLDRLAQADSNTPALLVEGEKCAEAANRLLGDKVVCMTWQGGSSATHKADLEPLSGRRIIIWPDADKPGFDAALRLSASLAASGASTVSVIEPPQDVPDGWDFADAEAEGWSTANVMQWLDSATKSAAEFGEIARSRFNAAGQPSASAPDSPGLRVVSLEDLLILDLPERGHVLAPVLPEQGLVMLYAQRGLGKTWVALTIAAAVASGSRLFGRWAAPRPRRVLYLDGEMPARVIKERLASITASGSWGPIPPSNLRILTPDLQPGLMPNIATPEGQSALEPFLEDVDLVIVDNIATMGHYGRENEAESWMPIQEWLLRLRRQGKSVLLIHHAGKGGNQRGTSAREDILDTVIQLRRPMDYQSEQGARFEVRLEKARGIFGDEALPFEVALHLKNEGACWEVKEHSDAKLEMVVSKKNEGMSVREIAKETGLSKSKVDRLLQGTRK